jgi:NitT/TauT family transport system substrate-binding protein
MYRFMTAVIVLMIGILGSTAKAEKLKVAIPQKGFWDSSWVDFAEKAGFFKQEDLEVEAFYTEGGAGTMTTITSGSVDIGLSNGTLGVIGAYAKGAPIKVISAEMTGAHELYWYVKAESPIHSLKDASESNTVAFSSPGSSSNLILLSLLKDASSKAKPVATGGVPGTYTQVMTGQIDIGWTAVPFALKDVDEGKVRIVARAQDAKELQDQSIRVNVVTEDTLKTKRATLVKFMRAYAHAVDWAYQNPQAIEIFAKNMNVSTAIAKKAVDEYYPKSAMQIDEIRGLDLLLKDALQFKYITSAMTAKELQGLIDIVYHPPAQ